MGALVLTCLLIGQVTWSKAFEVNAATDTAYSVVYDPADNAFVVVGHISNGPIGGLDILVLKVTADSGKIIWAKAYGIPADDYARDIVLIPDEDNPTRNNYVVVGYDVADRNADVVAFMLDNSGNLIWNGIYSTAAPDRSEYVYAVAVASDGLILVGKVEPGPIGDSFGLPDSSDGLAIKLALSNGGVIWSRVYTKALLGTELLPGLCFYDVIMASDSVFVTTGEDIYLDDSSDVAAMLGHSSNGASVTTIRNYKFPSALYSSGRAIVPSLTTSGYAIIGNLSGTSNRAFLLEVSDSLLPSWARSYSFNTYIDAFDVVQYRHGTALDYVLTGSVSPGTAGSFDSYIMSVSANGIPNWARALGGCGGSMTLADFSTHLIYVQSLSSFVSVGYTAWPSSWTQDNMLVIKTDTLGSILCPSQDSCMYSISVTANEAMPDTMTSCEEQEISLNVTPLNELDVIESDTLICAEWPSGVIESGCSYPIMTTLKVNGFTVTVPFGGQSFRLEVIDMAGRTIHTEDGRIGQREFDLPVRAAGVYMLRVTSEKGESFRKIVIFR